MNHNPNQPKEYDAVLGGQTTPPVTGVVLGGIEGVKRRLASSIVEARIAALSEALKYGETGLDLLIEALHDEVEQVQHSAAELLREKGGIKGNLALLEYDPWLFFTTWQNWNIENFNPQVGCRNSSSNAFSVTLPKFSNGINFDLHRFNVLLEYPQSKNLSALKCEIKTKYFGCKKEEFRAVVDALVAAREQLLNLKALFIGTSKQNLYGMHDIYLCNIRPVLKAYPNLELLQVRGRIDEDFLAYPNVEILQVRSRIDKSNLQVKTLKHERLKTLIIESVMLSDSNLAQICNFDLPSLEYLALWLSWCSKMTIDSLAPVLSGESFPNLAYLGLIDSENTDLLAQFIVIAPILERLKILDLSKGMLTDMGAEMLFNCPAIDRLHTLNVSKNQLSKKMVQQLSRLKCRVIANSQKSDRYNSVYE